MGLIPGACVASPDDRFDERGDRDRGLHAPRHPFAGERFDVSARVADAAHAARGHAAAAPGQARRTAPFRGVRRFRDSGETSRSEHSPAGRRGTAANPRALGMQGGREIDASVFEGRDAEVAGTIGQHQQFTSAGGVSNVFHHRADPEAVAPGDPPTELRTVVEGSSTESVRDDDRLRSNAIDRGVGRRIERSEFDVVVGRHGGTGPREELHAAVAGLSL